VDLLFDLLVVLLPTQIALHFWPDWALVHGIRVDYLAPAIYLTDIIVLSLLLKFKKFPKYLLYLLPFSVINILISSIWQVSLFRWIKVFEFILLAYLVFKDKEIIFKRIQKPLLVAVAYSLLIGFLQILKGGTLGGIFYFLGERSFNTFTPGIALMNVFGQSLLRPYATFPHPNVFAGFMLVSFFLFALKKPKGIIEKAGVALCLVGVIISFSLGAYLAFAVLVLVIIFFKHLKKVKKAMHILFYFAIYTSLVLPIAANFLLGGSLPENIENRLILSTTAGEAFSRSPLVGAGLGTVVGKSSLLQPTHNIFLLLLSEVGVVGVILFCYLLFRALKNSKSQNQFLLVPCLIAILLTGMFDHYWLTLQQGELVFAIVIGGLF